MRSLVAVRGGVMCVLAFFIVRLFASGRNVAQNQGEEVATRCDLEMDGIGLCCNG